MTITLAERRTVPEASGLPEQLAFKTAETMAGEAVAIDETEGIVTAIVSVTGVVDEVDDIIVPGAYRETLAKRNPKVCWAHSWEHPIGKVLGIEELMPGDKRLPTKTRDGKPWPKEAGALVATMQFNLRTDEGKNAFEVVRFYSETGECEYSIGYNVPAGKASVSGGTRYIKMLELYELSVVLFGAHTMTGTLSIKDAHRAMEVKASRVLAKALPPTEAKSGVDFAVLATKADARPPVTSERSADDAADADLTTPREESAEKPDQPDFSDGIMVAVYPDPACADAVANHIAGPDDTTPRDELHVTLAYLGKIGDGTISEQEVIDAVTRAVEGQPALEGEVGGIGMFPEGEDGAPTYAPVDVPGLGLLREQVVAELGDVVRNDHGFTPHMTLGYNIGLIQPVPPTPIKINEVRVVYGSSERAIALGAPLPEAKSRTFFTEQDPPVEAKSGDLWFRTNDATMHECVGENEWKAVDAMTAPVAEVNEPDGWYTEMTEVKRDLTAEQRRKKPTLPGSDTAWPIGDETDLRAAIQSYGRAKDDEKDKVKRWIIKRARELGKTDLLPEDWGVQKKALLDDYDPAFDLGFKSAEGDEMADFINGLTDDDFAAMDAGEEAKALIGEVEAWLEGKAVTPGGRAGDDSPVGTPGGRQNWVDKAGGLPRYIRMVAHALMRQGHSKARAIAIAVATMKRWASGVGDVTAKVRAAAAKAVAEWEAMKAKANATKTLDAGVPASGKSYPQMPGSYEEVQQTLREAIQSQYIEDVDENGNRNVYVDVRATWPDRVLYTVNRWGPVDECDHYLASYRYNEDGVVEFLRVDEVELTIVPLLADDGDEDEAKDMPLGDALPLAEGLLGVVSGIKTAQRAMEGKAGRVLSGANERALIEGLRHLLAVLSAAGIDLDDVAPDRARPTGNNGSDGDVRREMDPAVDLETTSPTATTKAAGVETEEKGLASGEVLTIDMDAHRALLAEIEEMTAEN